MIQETHLDRKWKPDVLDMRKFDFLQNDDLSSAKGGVMTMTRKISIDHAKKVESYKTSMLVTEKQV